jgi:hypothetical protein
MLAQGQVNTATVPELATATVVYYTAFPFSGTSQLDYGGGEMVCMLAVEGGSILSR